jgi:phage gp16-like protein
MSARTAPATKPARPVDRRARLATIHVAKKKLAMQEDSYRAMLQRLTGHESAADCTDAQLGRVIEEFRRLGFSAARRPADKPHVRKVYALWRELKPYLTDVSDNALRSFVRRQTGLQAPEWLDAQAANKVTEGLKAWLAREKAKEAAHVGA